MLSQSPWTLSSDQVLKQLDVDPSQGLSEETAQFYLQKYGRNKIGISETPGPLSVLVRQFRGLLVGLLLVAAAISIFVGDWFDALAIFAVLLVNAFIGFVTEMRALNAMESLKNLTKTHTRVLRGGDQKHIFSEELVPGDIIFLEAGDVVAADGRIVANYNLSVDESPLTGESMPVDKNEEVFEEKTPLSERLNMLISGTHITRGTAMAVITSTGMKTELGKIAQLTSEAKEEITPLEKRLDRLGRRLVVLTIFIAAVITVTGILSGKEILVMLQTAIALAVATVPEGLPIVATMALAKGLWAMAKENALINRLSAVETLGATSVIITDKTGTLTENQMTVSRISTTGEELDVKKMKSPLDQPAVKKLLEVITLCNDASLSPSGDSLGDPMEVALLRFSQKFVDKTSLPERTSEIPFETKTKMMATIHKSGEKWLYAVKGAPEAVIERCTGILDEKGKTLLMSAELKKTWTRKNEILAEKGLRVLAIAFKEELQPSDPYERLILLGLVGFIDPVREGIPEAIESCQKAGIRVVMATGDQIGTAVTIANDIGLPQEFIHPLSGADLPDSESWSEEQKERLNRTSVLCRVSPEQKLRLVEFYQSQGHVVAMTGDGINDAPALKKADIGVAMGLRGTQVAREASDMVLKDDRFTTIISAVQQGRIIFSNIRRFVIYLLSCNLSEVLIVGIASMISAKMPITPLQILFLNLVTDVFPALALGMGKGDKTYLDRPPRATSEKILENRHWQFILFYGGLMTALVLGVFYISQTHFGFSIEKTVTIAFLTLGLSQVFHVFNLRKKGANLFVNDITRNPHIWGAVVLCVLLLFASSQLSLISKPLALTPLDPLEWLCILGLSLCPLLGQLFLKME